MPSVSSADGTTIDYDITGAVQPLSNAVAIPTAMSFAVVPSL
jgi:hypothetical protein